MIDTQKERKESKHNSKGGHQITREEKKRKEKKVQNSLKTINKIAMSTLLSGASPVAQLVKDLPAVLETPVQFLGQEDPLEMG